jgi:GNAT superfamily N-acetyltransferase
MIAIRLMTAADIALGMRLKGQAGWNQSEADWRRLLAMDPDGCFVAELDGRAVGTTATTLFGPIGWISMVLVEASVRRLGIGTRLLEHALAHLDRAGARAARLDATALGRPVYEKLGFLAEYEVARWEGVAAADRPQALRFPTASESLDALAALDSQVTGTQRRRLIERLCQERPDAVRIYADGLEVLAYAAVRFGSRATQIGPLVARSEIAGRALADAALAAHDGRPILIDIPLPNTAAMRWAESRGLRVQRRFVRMCRGAPVHDQPEQIWASFGPEKG